MKKMLLAFLLPAILLTACDKEKIIQADDLPGNATSYINTHFAAQQILQVVKERDDLKTSYTVYLNNGTKLEFTRQGEIREIEGSEPIPANALPVLITSYVQTHYAGSFIKAWEIESSKQDITLSTGVKLEFDKQGNFLRIDD